MFLFLKEHCFLVYSNLFTLYVATNNSPSTTGHIYPNSESLTTNQLLLHTHQRKRPGNVYKVDFKKIFYTYDRLSCYVELCFTLTLRVSPQCLSKGVNEGGERERFLIAKRH